MQRCASIRRSASSAIPAAEQDAGRALQQHRQVAEDEPADEAELDDGQVDVVAGQAPARADALGRVAQRVARVRDALGRRRRARGVQDQRERRRRGAACARRPGGPAPTRRRRPRAATRQQRQAIARHLRGTWRSPSRRRSSRSRVARVCSISADICCSLNIGGSGASTTPRCRQPSIATAASIEWRPSRITTSPGSMPGVGQAVGDGDGRAAQLRVGHARGRPAPGPRGRRARARARRSRSTGRRRASSPRA